MVYAHTGTLFSHKMEENPAIFDNMAETVGYYTKWNKPDREVQILFGTTYTWIINKSKPKFLLSIPPKQQQQQQ